MWSPRVDGTALPDISERDRALLASVEKWLDRHAAESQVSVEQLADALALEKRTLQRKLKALVGKTPTDYIRHFRLQRAMRLMLQSDRSINDIALSCGFSSPQAFSRMFFSPVRRVAGSDGARVNGNENGSIALIIAPGLQSPWFDSKVANG